MNCNITDGRASAWCFRWLELVTKPGKYTVTIQAGSFSRNFDAVIDDFGNLVEVAA